MKISAVLCARNDNYGGNLITRSTFCLNSMVTTFDEVWYIDWNSDNGSLIYEIYPNLFKTGKLHHIIIPPESAAEMTRHDAFAPKCCDVLARNIGLRRATGDWLVSTNIDIVAPKRDTMLQKIKSLESNTFYTVSRRSLEPIELSNYSYFEIEKLRDYLYKTYVEERKYFEKVQTGDDYSIINCCGDFQLAAKSVWNEIRGFEEKLIYPLYADTNIQKKSVMHGFGLQAIFDVPFFHINHTGGAGGFGTVNKKANDPLTAITFAGKTENFETWGFSDVDIEHEVI